MLPVTPGFTFFAHPMTSRANNDTTSALDALASLASTHFSDGVALPSPDSKSMPPPPRRTRRIRSASNPEGMEKWDTYNYPKDNNDMKRLRFVLPSCILEEELATANDMCIEHEKEQQRQFEEMERMKLTKTFGRTMPVRKIGRTDFSIQSQPEVDSMNNVYGTSPDTVISSLAVQTGNKSAGSRGKKAKKGARKKKSLRTPSSDDKDIDENAEDESEEEVNESDLDPKELLRRARSRLFEDLSAENGMEKGAMAFPHSLEKYKEVRHWSSSVDENTFFISKRIAHIFTIFQQIYNQNGRIGIYTPAERAAIISKFISKRTRRTWKKKIRYTCRKSLADRRMRVKGRFVKRAVEKTAKNEPVVTSSDTNTVDSSTCSESNSSRGDSPLPSAPPSGPLAPVNEDTDEDMDMNVPDVNDPDAGFKPTESQPFRRTRRHTIT